MTPSLVAALEGETEIQAQPLPLDRVVPWRRVWAVAVAGGGRLLILLLPSAVLNPEWRIALERALLSNRPYTTLSVAPGNLTVEQGESVPIGVELQGRLKRDVVLYTRPEVRGAAGRRVEGHRARPPGPRPCFETRAQAGEGRETAGLSRDRRFGVEPDVSDRRPIPARAQVVRGGPRAARLHGCRAEHGEGGRPPGHRGDRRDVPDRV